MKIVQIDDNNLNKITEFSLINDPYEIITEIKNNHFNSDVFLINVNYKTENISRVQNAGILLLKLLRLNNFNQHCILYSFLSREQLMIQDPRNIIIFSEGVAFCRLPFDFTSLNFDELALKKAPADLSAFFKAEFTLPDDRHFFANWWGVLQLWKVHKAISKQPEVENFENLFAQPNTEYNSYQGLIARYLNCDKENDIKNHLNNLLKQEEERFGKRKRSVSRYEDILKDKEYELTEATEKIEILKNAFSFDGSLNDFILKLNEIDQKSLFSTEKIKELIKILENHPHQIDLCKEFLDFKTKIEEEKTRIEKDKDKIKDEIRVNLKLLEQEKSFSSSKFSLETITNFYSDKKNHPSIVFVDDQAEDGWSAIFQRMIYGDKSDSFTVVIPQKDNSNEEIASAIIKMVNETRANLLILDLRLKGEKGNTTDMTSISGVQILKILEDNNIPCPILITTASNKIWSYKETLNFGASAFWIKEGLDDKYDLNKTVENYLRFIDLVYSLCYSEEYRLLYQKMRTVFFDIQNSSNLYWWQKKFWDDNLSIEINLNKIPIEKLKLVDKNEVVNSLNAGLEMYKEYLLGKLQSHNPINLNKSIASLVIIQFNNVLEIIHRLDKDNEDYNLNAKIKSQLKNQFNKYENMLKIRNSAAHEFNADFNSIKEYVELFITYLTSDILFNNTEEPQTNKNYISEIESKSGFTCNLKNPNLKLESQCTSIKLNYRDNPKINSEKLTVGMNIRFKLKINIALNSYSYFAINAEIINNQN